MHHSYIIEKLNIKIPNGIRYKIKHIPGDELEGRK